MSEMIIALMLAICMAFAPSAPATDSEMGFPPMTVTLQGADIPESVVALNRDDAGLPVVSFRIGDDSIAITSDAGYITNGDGTFTTSVWELYPLVGSLLGLPMPTEADTAATRLLLTGVVTKLSSEAFHYAVLPDGFLLSCDLDQLAHELHTIVPEVLRAYPTTFDATLMKYTPMLLGESMTSAVLADMWGNLGLDQAATGVSFSLSIQVQEDCIYLTGTVSDAEYTVTITEESLTFEVTTADGTVYAFDSDDTIFVASIADALIANYISEKAISVQQTADAEDSQLLTATLRVDLAALAADLNRGMADIIASNNIRIDTLLDKYRSWVALADSALAGKLSANYLMNAFHRDQLISLPTLTGELIIITDEAGGRISLDGSLGDYTLDGVITFSGSGRRASSTLSILLSHADRFNPTSLNFDFTLIGDTLSATLTSSEMLLDLFRSVSFSITDGYNLQWSLTTDTNAISAIYSEEMQYADFRIGPVSLTLSEDEYDYLHLDFSSPEFYASLRTNETDVSFDSTYVGFDMHEYSIGGLTINGYLSDGDDCFATFGVNQNYWEDETDLYWHTDDFGNLIFTYTDEGIRIRLEEDVIDLLPLPGADNGAALVAVYVNHERFGTLAATDRGSQFLLELYQGEDLTAAPMLTLTIDAAPAPYTVPDDAQPVDGETFLEMWEDWF